MKSTTMKSTAVQCQQHLEESANGRLAAATGGGRRYFVVPGEGRAYDPRYSGKWNVNS